MEDVPRDPGKVSTSYPLLIAFSGTQRAPLSCPWLGHEVRHPL